jgi:7-cyano-7-deazaguanine reductase
MDHGLTLLGAHAALPVSPALAKLEVVANPHTDTLYVARFTAPEFTSLCPVTGQPDFARFVIDYVPDRWIIESKSLKLFLGSFRNHAAFHEDCTVSIGKRLQEAASPIFIRVCAFWYARGGIPIDVFWQEGVKPADVYLPDPGVPTFSGR